MPDFINNLLNWRRVNFQQFVAQEQQLINHLTGEQMTVLDEIREINRLFGSRPHHIEQIAQRINDLHPNYNNGDLHLLNDAARAISNQNENISTASFTLATRLCAYHNLVAYPLYDILIEKLIIRLREQHHYLPNATEIRREAGILHNVYDDLRDISGFQTISYKDMYDVIHTLAFIKFYQTINHRYNGNVLPQHNFISPILRSIVFMGVYNRIDIQNINLIIINFQRNGIYDAIAEIVDSAIDEERRLQRRNHNQRI